MKGHTLFVSIVILAALVSCSQIPKPEPPPGGTLTARIVLAEVYTQTG